MDKNKQKAPSNSNIEINASNDIVKGRYCNAIKVTITDSEATLDFAYVYNINESAKQGELVSRIIVNPNFVEKIASSLNTTLKSHREKQQK